MKRLIAAFVLVAGIASAQDGGAPLPTTMNSDDVFAVVSNDQQMAQADRMTAAAARSKAAAQARKDAIYARYQMGPNDTVTERGQILRASSARRK